MNTNKRQKRTQRTAKIPGKIKAAVVADNLALIIKNGFDPVTSFRRKPTKKR